MLLKTFTKEIFRSKCMPSAESVHCFAHLDEDIQDVLPYLNAELGGSSYTKEPPSVTFKVHGKLMTVHPRKIAINALKDEKEAEKILIWLKGIINDTWDRHDEIEPSYESVPQPVLFEILKLLPKSNCRECNEPTCMVFAARAVEGVKGHNDCPTIEAENREKLKKYLSQFHFE
ncbi:(Fe-S)-binding protein [Desulfobacula sp.]|uniref:(Fe-S)-binding protein n=1 Tax=Desulfobacula sp. TaxID=2593537 RepID=UPI00262CC980|nr:(Fe-S)-binding protein [Desulfobacula sp.]